MKNTLRLLPVILSLLLFGAHFLRVGNLIMTALCLALIFMLFLRQRWVPRLIQLVLILASIEWLRYLYLLIDERSAIGRSWTVAAIILGTVAAITALSTLVFRNKALRKHYLLDENLLAD